VARMAVVVACILPTTCEDIVLTYLHPTDMLNR
jgi:hypothetical protein